MRKHLFSLVILLALIVPLTVTAQGPGIAQSAVGEPKAVPAAPNPEDVLWDQYANFSGTSLAAQDFESAYDAYDVWTGDDFQNLEAWTIDTIVSRAAWTGFVDLNNATAIHWYICADSGGAPSCVPGDGSEFWTAHLAPTDPQVSLGVFEPEDFVLSLDTPISLPAGTWWIIFQVSLEYTYYGQVGISTTANAAWGTPAMQINPNGGFGMGSDWWINDYNYDAMFRLEGTAGGGDMPMFAKIKVDARPYDMGYVAAGIVRVVDEFGTPLEGAEVTAFLKDPDANTWFETDFTNPNGRVKFMMTHPTGGPWLFCIDEIQLAGYDWVPGPRCGFIWYPGDPP